MISVSGMEININIIDYLVLLISVVGDIDFTIVKILAANTKVFLGKQ